MLRWRMLLGTLLVAALVVLCTLDARLPEELGGAILLPVALLVAIMATREVLDLAAAGNMRPLRWPVYAGTLLIVGGELVSRIIAYLTLEMANYQGRLVLVVLLAPVWCLVLALLLSFVGEMCRYRKPGGNIANLSAAVFALIYVGFMLSFAVQLRTQWGIRRWSPGSSS